MKNNKRTSKIKVKDMAHVGVSVALMSVCAWIIFPTPWGVPVTLQTLAIFAVVGLLGPWKGCAAVAVYLVLGAVGLPVFSGGSGGLGILMGVTGGYLWGFIPGALIAGVLCRIWNRRMSSPQGRFFATLAAMSVGQVICYAAGTVWLCAVYARGGEAVTVGVALLWGVVPYLLPDALKLIVAAMVAERGKLWLK